VLIKKGNTAIGGLTVFPNPVATDYVQARMSFSSRERIELRVVDLHGRILAKQIQTVSSGNNNIPVRLPALTAGVYTLQVLSSEKNLSTKFTVIR